MKGGLEPAAIRHRERNADDTPKYKTRFINLQTGLQMDELEDETHITIYTLKEYNEAMPALPARIRLDGLTIIKTSGSVFGAIGTHHILKSPAATWGINIRTLTGENIAVEGSGSDSILDIKRKIQEKEDIAIGQQVLLFAGKSLEDERTLSSYGINIRNAHSLTLRSRVGGVAAAAAAAAEPAWGFGAGAGAQQFGQPAPAPAPAPAEPIPYANVVATTGDMVQLRLYDADTTNVQGNPNPKQPTIHNGSIMEDMRAPSDKKQMFVLPSQLNGAEYPDPTTEKIVHPGNWLQRYLNDGTGGPRGQLAGDHNIAKYIVSRAENDTNKHDTTTINYVRQICNDPIFGGKLFLQNGYLQVRDLSTDQILALRGMMSTIELLVSENLPVSGYDVNLEPKDYEGKKIHLAYGSAVPIGMNYGNDETPSGTIKEVANIIMEAQYIAAFKAAKHLNVDELLLMPLGGGVFGNERSDIADNIMKALRAVDMTGIDVKLLTYKGSPGEAEEFTAIFAGL